MSSPDDNPNTPSTANPAEQEPDEVTVNYRYDPNEIVDLGHRRITKTKYMWILMTIICAAWFLTNFDQALAGAAGPPVIEEFGISSSVYLYAIAFTGLFSLFASFVAGVLVDRYGRKLIFVLTLLFLGLFNGLLAVSVAFWMFILLRSVSNVTHGGSYPAITTLLAEEASPKQRGKLQGISWLFLSGGSAIAGILATAVLDVWNWRILFLFAFAPMLLVVFATRYLRESPRYLEFKKMGESLKEAGISAESITSGFSREALARVFGPKYRVQTILMMSFACFSAGSITFTFYVAPLYLVDDRGFSASQAAGVIAVMSWSALVGNLPGGYLTDMISPKYMMLVYEGFGVLLMLPFVFLPDAGDWAIYLAFVSMGFFVQVGFLGLAVYMPGAFPAHVRGTAIGVIMMGTTFASILIPLIAGAIFGLGDIAVPILMLSLPTVAFLAALGLRYMPAGDDIDTIAKRMEEQLEE